MTSDSSLQEQQQQTPQAESMLVNSDHVGPLERSWVNKGKSKAPPQRYWPDDKVYWKQSENAFFEGDWVVVKAELIETPGDSKLYWEYQIQDRGGEANPRWARETFLKRQ